MGEVWFTADTHFGHRMLVERGYRPFATLREHDEALMTWWNETVRPGDQVWHLGDWCMGGGLGRLANIDRVRDLHGNVHLITGNHDAPWPGNRDAHKHQAGWIYSGFASVQAFARRRVAGHQVMLSHFPYEGDHVDGPDRASQYRLVDDGLPLLHGHVHDAWARRGRQVNVGVDVRGFRPVHLDTLVPELLGAVP